MEEKPDFKTALKFWTKLGFISFGGPAGQIAIMHEYVVEKEKWISEKKFLHALNYCMLLPGPEAMQLATYIGWLLHGTWGGLAAGVLFVLPSMIILLFLSILYVTFGEVPWVFSMFNALKPAVIAIVILALIKIGRKSLVSASHYLFAIAAFICIYFLNVPFPLIIFGAVVLALLSKYLLTKQVNIKNQTDSDNYPFEKFKSISATTAKTPAPLKFKQLFALIFVAVLLWSLPLILFLVFSADFLFWKNLSTFFTKAAFVTVGGAYAVLPYVAQVTVEQLNWLTSQEMIDGLALGETTPGPLVMVLAFVGFMAGYNHYGNSLLMGSIGLMTTTFYTFLPCFFFIFIGAPVIERTQDNKVVKELLSFVTAAVVGVVLNLTLYLIKEVVFQGSFSAATLDYVAIVWIIISFIAMYRLKTPMMLWIVISALFGLLMHGLANNSLL